MGLYFHKAVCKFVSKTFSFDDKRGWGSCIEMESYRALAQQTSPAGDSSLSLGDPLGSLVDVLGSVDGTFD